jgi:hypothetical protein
MKRGQLPSWTALFYSLSTLGHLFSFLPLINALKVTFPFFMPLFNKFIHLRRLPRIADDSRDNVRFVLWDDIRSYARSGNDAGGGITG